MTDQRSPPCASHPAVTSLPTTQLTDGWLNAALLIQRVPSQYCPYGAYSERITPMASIEPAAVRTMHSLFNMQGK